MRCIPIIKWDWIMNRRGIERRLACVYETGRLVEFLYDILRQLAALATGRGDAQLALDFGHVTGTVATHIADLVIGDLSANTDVHGILRVAWHLNANENDCQQYLDLLV